MRFLTIIPARAGSKGIKNKNFINFLGRPLIEHTLSFAKKLKNNNIIISSDSKKSNRLIDKYKTISGYKRPKKLSKDNVMLEDTLEHVISWAIDNNISFDYILLLQPTSPLRKIYDFNKIKTILKKRKVDSLCSVTKVKYHPAEYVKKNYKSWSFLLKTKRGLRQKYEDNYYFIDGSYYAVSKKYFIKNKKILSKNNFFFPISLQHPIDIDNPIDLKIGEIIYKHRI
jgi:CMP-N,N'-diacetyllegionaminic acid synthase|tara:strand:+ start:164 stop:844 length:681 start_codon:yes stop_codon:yes gene_type:complete